MTRTRILVLGAAGLAALVFALACGGSSNALPAPPVTTGAVGFITTDASTETWSNVSVIVRKASLVLASDTAAAHPVRIYDGSQDATAVNLLQEDAVDDLLGQVSGVPAGTYDRLIVEVDGAPATITLVPAVNAAAVLTPAAIPAAQIIVKGPADPANPGWKVLPTITLTTPLTVAAGQTSAVAVDFNLAHPAFIVEHDVTIGTDTTPLYVVNFGAKGVFTHKSAAALNQYYLRRHLGTVASVAADGSSLTLTTEHGQTLAITPDPGANPTLFYNLDVKPVKAQASNLVPAALTPGLAVECTTRYQVDGSLTAVRVWYTAQAANLPSWTPEGHITLVDRTNGIIYVLDSQGDPKPITIATGTQWFWHGNTALDLSGGDGLAFLAQVERFFKVHVTVADPTATPLTAATVDIQRAVFEGNIASATAASFTYTKVFADLSTATHTLGFDPGAFSFWDFTFPGEADSTVADFITQANATVGTFNPYASSTLNWAGGTTGWNAVNTVFMPIQVGVFAQTVTAPFANGAMTIQTKALLSVPVTLDATAKEQPLVTLYTKQPGAVTVTPLTSDQWGTYLTTGAIVRVYGVPDLAGNLKGYYVNIYN